MYKDGDKIMVIILDCDAWNIFDTFDAAYDFIAEYYIMGA
jgi:hypothetical protein